MLQEETHPHAQFTEMYRRDLPYVWKVLARLGAKPSDREDLAHDIFATAFRRWNHYDQSRPVRPWLFGIAYRVVLDFKRKHQNHREEVTESIEVRDESRTADEVVAATQGRAIAIAALSCLELERRAVFILHEIDEQPIPEVAEALGIPLNTAYSRLRLARRDFNIKVAELQVPGGVSHVG